MIGSTMHFVPNLNRIFLIVLLFFNAASFASDASLKHIEERLFDKAIEKNVSKAELDFSVKQYNQSYLTFLPNPSISRTFSYNLSNQQSFIGAENKEGSDIVTTFSLGYNLLDLALLGYELENRDLEVSLRAKEYYLERLKFRKNFRNSLINLRKLEHLVREYEKITGIDSSELSLTEKRYRSGAVSKLDFLRAKRAHLSSRKELASGLLELEKGREKWKRQYGLSESEMKGLLSSDVEADVNSLRLKTRASVVDQALSVFDPKFHHSYQVAKTEKTLSENQKTVERLEYFPNVGISYSAGLENESKSLTLSLSYDIGAALRDSNHFERAKYRHLLAENKLKMSARDVKVSSVEFSKLLNDRVADYYTKLDELVLIEEIYRLSKRSFERGEIDSQSYYGDWQQYVNMVIQVNGAKHDLMLTINDIEFELGRMSDGRYIF